MQLTRLCQFVLMATLLSGCSSGSTPDQNPDQRTGILLDSPVSGISFSTPSGNGTTDSAGSFTYLIGDSITFSIGDLRLPETVAADIVTPLSIFETNSVNDVRVVNLSRLLQSLDSDGNPNNGIAISPDAAASAPLNIDFADTDFASQVANLVANSGSSTTSLISAEDAIAHLTGTLVDNGITGATCLKTHALVGQSARFNKQAHGVTGVLTIVDDCTIDITEFGYDGGGPKVYFYAARDGAYGSDDAFIIGPLLNGQEYDNASFRLTIPEGRSLDDFNSISVWCADFNANFGDAMLNGDGAT